MSRRILAVAFAAGLVLLTLQTPAVAKGPDHATITGPGIGTQKLTWDGPSLDDLMQVTRLWDGADVAAWDVDRPDGDLGPRYEVTYHVPDLYRPSSGKATLIHQELYPYAAAGPVVYMPEGQTMYDMAMPYGWLATDHELVRVVKELGAPPRVEPAEPRVEPAAHESATTPSDGPGRAPLAWGAAAAVLLAATAVGWRRLRVRRRA